MTNLKGYAGVNHIVIVADSAADAEHGILVRTVEGADRHGVFTAVIAVACGKIPLVVGVEIERMKGCQGSCSCADFVNAAV